MMGVGRREKKRRPFFEVLGGKKKADDQSERERHPQSRCCHKAGAFVKGAGSHRTKWPVITGVCVCVLVSRRHRIG